MNMVKHLIHLFQMIEKAVFMNGLRKYVMKIKSKNKDGSVILIDGTLLYKSEILEIKKEK